MPEVLYETGALAPASSGFALRASAAPDVAANWYNFGAAEYRLGDAGVALAAWTRARPAGPAEPAIRRALKPGAGGGRAILPRPVDLAGHPGGTGTFAVGTVAGGWTGLTLSRGGRHAGWF